MVQYTFDPVTGALIPIGNQQRGTPSEEPSGKLQVTSGGQTPPITPPSQTSDSGRSQSAQGQDANTNIASTIMNLMRMRSAQQGWNAGGAAAGGGYVSNAGGYIGASPGAGQSGYMYPNQAAAAQAGDVGAGAGAGAAGGGGPSAANVQAGMGLISMAGKTGDALKNYAATANWQPIQSHIPDPSQFQRQQQQYDFQRNQIV